MSTELIVPLEYTLKDSENFTDAIHKLTKETGEALYCAKVGVKLFCIPMSKWDEFLKQENINIS